MPVRSGSPRLAMGVLSHCEMIRGTQNAERRIEKSLRSEFCVLRSRSYSRQQLLRQRVVLVRAARFRREREDRFPVRRAFFQADRLRDDGVEQAIAEDQSDLIVNVFGERRALV